MNEGGGSEGEEEEEEGWCVWDGGGVSPAVRHTPWIWTESFVCSYVTFSYVMGGHEYADPPGSDASYTAALRHDMYCIWKAWQ